jgi:hypothetical protein
VDRWAALARSAGAAGWGGCAGGPHQGQSPDSRAPTGPSEPPAPELVAELAAAGLPDEFAAAADDQSWDGVLSDSLDAASKARGPHPLSPTIVLDGESLHGLSGPVFSPAPTGEAALRAWDAVRVLLAEPGFFELRRARTGPPAFAAG